MPGVDQRFIARRQGVGAPEAIHDGHWGVDKNERMRRSWSLLAFVSSGYAASHEQREQLWTQADVEGEAKWRAKMTLKLEVYVRELRLKGHSTASPEATAKGSRHVTQTRTVTRTRWHSLGTAVRDSPTTVWDARTWNIENGW